MVDFESIIKKSLKEDNILDYTIVTDTHVVDSNVRTFEIKSNDLTYVFTMNSETGEIFNITKSREHSRSVVEDPILITDRVNVAATLYFELYDKYFVGEKIISFPPIKLLVDSKNIVGFEINVPDVEENTIKEANEKASRLVNFLGLIQNQPVKHKRPRMRQFMKDKTVGTVSCSCDAILVMPYSLDLSKSMFMLEEDSIINQKLAHAQNGIRALADNNFGEAISEFFIVIEKEDLGLPKKYDNLRHAVKHNKIGDTNAINDLKNNFGIDMEEGSYLNINDPYIQDRLADEAQSMQQIVFDYLSKILKNTGCL